MATHPEGDSGQGVEAGVVGEEGHAAIRRGWYCRAACFLLLTLRVLVVKRLLDFKRGLVVVLEGVFQGHERELSVVM